MPTPDSLYSVTYDARVETAEGIVAIVQNAIERFSAEIMNADAADVARALRDRPVSCTLIAPKDDMVLEELVTVIGANKDLRGWVVGRARDTLITHLVGRQGQADMIGRTLRRFGPGKWKLTIAIARPAAKAESPKSDAPVAAGATVPNGGGK